MRNTTWVSVRSVLEGQTLVVVGGDRREGALARLCGAFNLPEVIHCPTRKNDASPRCFEATLRGPGIVLVVWALGLSRTHHGEHLHRMCRELRIPWVDCFRIPHPNALADRLNELKLVDALVRRRALNDAALRRIGGAA